MGIATMACKTPPTFFCIFAGFFLPQPLELFQLVSHSARHEFLLVCELSTFNFTLAMRLYTAHRKTEGL